MLSCATGDAGVGQGRGVEGDRASALAVLEDPILALKDAVRQGEEDELFDYSKPASLDAQTGGGAGGGTMTAAAAAATVDALSGSLPGAGVDGVDVVGMSTRGPGELGDESYSASFLATADEDSDTANGSLQGLYASTNSATQAGSDQTSVPQTPSHGGRPVIYRVSETATAPPAPGKAGASREEPPEDQDPDLQRTLRRGEVVLVKRVYVRNPDYRVGWVVDHSLDRCMRCGRSFSFLFNRRHHCRACGDLVCDDCSGGRRPVVGLGSSAGPLYRVCTACLAETQDNGAVHPRTHACVTSLVSVDVAHSESPMLSNSLEQQQQQQQPQQQQQQEQQQEQQQSQQQQQQRQEEENAVADTEERRSTPIPIEGSGSRFCTPQGQPTRAEAGVASSIDAMLRSSIVAHANAHGVWEAPDAEDDEDEEEDEEEDAGQPGAAQASMVAEEHQQHLAQQEQSKPAKHTPPPSSDAPATDLIDYAINHGHWQAAEDSDDEDEDEDEDEEEENEAGDEERGKNDVAASSATATSTAGAEAAAAVAEYTAATNGRDENGNGTAASALMNPERAAAVDGPSTPPTTGVREEVASAVRSRRAASNPAARRLVVEESLSSRLVSSSKDDSVIDKENLECTDNGGGGGDPSTTMLSRVRSSFRRIGGKIRRRDSHKHKHKRQHSTGAATMTATAVAAAAAAAAATGSSPVAMNPAMGAAADGENGRGRSGSVSSFGSMRSVREQLEEMECTDPMQILSLLTEEIITDDDRMQIFAVALQSCSVAPRSAHKIVTMGGVPLLVQELRRATPATAWDSVTSLLGLLRYAAAFGAVPQLKELEGMECVSDTMRAAIQAQPQRQLSAFVGGVDFCLSAVEWIQDEGAGAEAGTEATSTTVAAIRDFFPDEVADLVRSGSAHFQASPSELHRCQRLLRELEPEES